MMTDLLTAEQVAERLGITVDQVKRRTLADRWPCVRFSSRTIRYREEHAEQIIAMYEAVSEPAAPSDIFGQTSRSKAKSA